MNKIHHDVLEEEGGRDNGERFELTAVLHRRFNL